MLRLNTATELYADRRSRCARAGLPSAAAAAAAAAGCLAADGADAALCDAAPRGVGIKDHLVYSVVRRIYKRLRRVALGNE